MSTTPTSADPHAYIDAVADALRAAGVTVTDPYAQTRESRDTETLIHEGTIVIGDDGHPDDPDLPASAPVCLAWDEEAGWRIMHGGQHGAYNNVHDLPVAVDDSPSVVVDAALATPWVEPDGPDAPTETDR